MLLPNNPDDLKTTYKPAKSDLLWTKRMLENHKYGFWGTTDAIYMIRDDVKAVTLSSYNEGLVPDKVLIENIARMKKVLNTLNWDFGYDKILNKTSKLNKPLEKLEYIISALNKQSRNYSSKDLFDVDQSIKDYREFLIKTVIEKEPGVFNL